MDLPGKPTMLGWRLHRRLSSSARRRINNLSPSMKRAKGRSARLCDVDLSLTLQTAIELPGLEHIFREVRDTFFDVCREDFQND